MPKPNSAVLEYAMRRRVLLGMAPKPPLTTLKLVTLVNGPVLTTGIGVRKIWATKKAPALLGFKPVLSLTSVPLEVKLSAEVHITDAGLSAAS